ncbi:hormone receptor 4-like [Portunus trituberculatus]|uniref:hormone receptor 4-like n=1 Tax=Portunus trituberculatus TaxID=210409 RepID=UPI001E1CBE33|nr:hormone receptor 4-like [Portunus trituberculatus]XP_045123176.1 hormone receptor 4-like [Portunus trituberculatus]
MVQPVPLVQPVPTVQPVPLVQPVPTVQPVSTVQPVPRIPPPPVISLIPPVSPPPLISSVSPVPTGHGEAYTDTHDEEETEQARTLQSLRTRLANLEAELLAAEADAEVEGLCTASTSSTTDGGGGWRGAGCSQGHSPVHTEKEIEEAVETLESLRTHLLSLKTEITEDGGSCSSGTMPGGRGSQSPPAATHKTSGNTSPREHNSPQNIWSGADSDHNHGGAPDALPHQEQGAGRPLLGRPTASPVSWLDRTTRPNDVFWNWSEQ